MARRSGMFDGILEADGFRARMKALADRTVKLARSPRFRPARRVGGGARRAAQAPASRHLRPVMVKLLYHDRGRRALPNTVKALANYLSKQGPLFDGQSLVVDKDQLAAGWAEDRRVFHVIVSPNDGHRIADMVGYARDLVARWEQRTGPLAWAAAVETKPDMAHPQGNRHLHIMIRGVQDGHDLILDRGLVSQDLRRDAQEAATDRLGWMSEREMRAYHDQLERIRQHRDELARMERARADTGQGRGR